MIPEGVTVIGYCAFYNCQKLVLEENLPQSIQKIEESAFEKCTALTAVGMSYNNTVEFEAEIGSNAFAGCTNLKEVNLSENVTSIGSYAFGGCTALKELTLPESVTYLGEYFIAGTAISTITIPKNVNRSGSYYSNGALANCKTLNTVIFEEGIREIPSYICASGDYTSYITKVVIPEDVTVIGSSAFYNCQKMSIYGYSGSYAETYAKENNIPFVTVAVSKKATISEVLGKLDVDHLLKGIDFGDMAKIDGPEITINDKTFTLFTIDAAGLKLDIGKHVQASVDMDEKTVQILIGFKPIDESVNADPSEETSGISGTRKRSAAWEKEFRDMKSFYKAVGGNKLSDKEIENKLKALNCKLYDSDAVLGLSASAKISGYAEFSFSSGEFVYKEGGVIVSASIQENYSRPIASFPAAYVAASFNAKLDGTLKLERVNEYYSPEVEAEIEAEIGIGLGLGSKRAKTYVEGGLKGTLEIDLAYPKSTLEEALGLKLFGNLYVSSSLFGFDGPGYEKKFWEWQVYPKKTSIQATTMNLDTVAVSNRKYLAKKATLLSVEAENGEDIYLDRTVYPYNLAQIVELPDKSKLMVWVGDDSSKTDVNKTSIMYAIYDGTNWSEVNVLAETGGLNDYPIVYQQEDAVYIVWQKSTKVLETGVTLTDVLSSIDLYYAVYQNGKMSGATAVTTNSTYEMMQQIAVKGNDIYIAWVENSKNDIFMSEGNTSVILAKRSNGSWTKETIYTGTSSIDNLAMDYVNGKLRIAYEMGRTDSNGNYAIDVYTWQDGVSKLISADSENIRIVGSKMYYVQNSKLMVYDMISGKETETGLFGIGDYDVMVHDDIIYVISNDTNGFTGELYVYTYNQKSGMWSDPIQLTDYGKYIRSFSSVVDEDGTLLTAINLVTVDESASSGSIYGDAVLRVVKLGSTPDIKVDTGIVYDYGDVKPGNTIPLEFQVTNNSICMVNNLTAKLYDEDDRLLDTVALNAEIESGDTVSVQCLYTLPDKLQKHTIFVKIQAEGEENVEDNEAWTTIGYGDLKIENAYLSGTSSSAIIKGSIKNSGYENAENIVVQLVDGKDNSIVLGEFSVSSVVIGEESPFEFKLDKRYLDVNPLTTGNTVDVVVTTDTEERNYENNTRQVLIQSSTDAAMVLNYENVELKQKDTIELAVSYSFYDTTTQIEWSSSNIKIAKVDENGKVTAVGNGIALITAKAGNKSVVCYVTVADEEEGGILLSANSVLMDVGDTRTISATLLAKGNKADIVWDSSNPEVAVISDSGQITALHAGKTIITATLEARTATCTVTVYASGVMGYSVTGTITSYGTQNTPASIVLLNGTEEVAQVESTDDTYTFPSVPAGTYTLQVGKENHVTRTYDITVESEDMTQDVKLCLIGDVTGDGKVNTRDLNRLYAHVNGTNPLEGYEFACGEVTGDGKLNTRDLNRLYAHISESNRLW